MTGAYVAPGALETGALQDDTQPVLFSFTLLAGLIAFAVGLNTRLVLSDADSYWHIAVGRWMLEHRTVPVRDVFSHSVPGIPFTAHEWLSELLMARVHDTVGWQGLQVMAALSFAFVIMYMLRFLFARMEPLHAIALATVCASMIVTHLLARPHVIVWPITVVWTGTLVQAVERRTRPPWWLLAMLLLWTNLHASFTLGLVFAGALALEAFWEAGERDARWHVVRQWAPFLALAALCVLCNPRGVYAITHALSVMRLKATLALVAEWRSADFHHMQPFLVWTIAVLLLAFTGRLRLTLFRAFFVLGLFYLALKHQRYHSLVGLVSPYLLAGPLAAVARAHAGTGGSDVDALDRLFRKLASRAGAVGVGIALLLAVGLAWFSARVNPARPNVIVTPERALAAFNATGALGNVFNTYSYGGYLIYRGVPVFFDGRGDMYGDALMTEASNASELRTDRALQKLLAKYRIGWTLLHPESPAVQLLDFLPEWKRVYGDSVAVVHVRRDLLPAVSPASLPASQDTAQPTHPTKSLVLPATR